MSSDLREQCALLELLLDYPTLAPAEVSQALRAGLTDLYAGGVTAVDTQTGATCLAALHKTQAQGGATAPVDVQIGSHKARLALAAGEERTEWWIAQPSSGLLQLSPAGASQAPLSYVAELSWREDAREAQASAVGLALERHYAVLRDRRWQPVASQLLQEGDWIRVTLVLETGAPRYFVAVTDELPGGLQPTDLSLGSVGGVDVQALSDPGSFWFDTRKLDPRRPRFYAERLPAGQHEIHYFARIGNSGDYLAAPAVAELMYGSATRARTSSARLHVAAKSSASQSGSRHTQAGPLAGGSDQAAGYDRQSGAQTQPP